MAKGGIERPTRIFRFQFASLPVRQFAARPTRDRVACCGRLTRYSEVRLSVHHASRRGE